MAIPRCVISIVICSIGKNQMDLFERCATERIDRAHRHKFEISVQRTKGKKILLYSCHDFPLIFVCDLIIK